jgi:hypothetical protein
MNDKMIQIGLDSGMLNYVDNETPRHYFLSGHADEQDLQKFAELIIRECIAVIHEQERIPEGFIMPKNAMILSYAIQNHFGVK